MKKLAGIFLIIIGLVLAGLVGYSLIGEEGWLAPEFTNLSGSVDQSEGTDLLTRYSFENLRAAKLPAGEVKIGGVIEEEEGVEGRFFWYQAGENRVSGRIDLPTKPGEYPVILMLRGYADKEGYFTGSGTHRAAQFLAQQGYITLAPDFLGFGSSDKESEDILLNRFRRPETVLYLLASLDSVNEALDQAGLGARLDSDKIGFWAHSNGGQITLSLLQITGESYPATLWAPVTQSFPDSILEYASELDDDGQLVIGRIREFEQEYDSADYSIGSFWSWLKGPIQIHQGTGDTAVAEAQTRETVVILQEEGLTVDYFVYPGADHNLKQVWAEAIERDLEFFERWL